MGTFIVLIIVAALVGLAVFSLVKKRKSGCSCGCGCGGCAMKCDKKTSGPEG